jgi:hypothetical protein
MAAKPVMHRATEGSGSVTTQVAPATACAYLVDPRHAAKWFAAVTVEDLPSGALREGQRWRFVERGSARPVELVRLDCPRAFTWQTRLTSPRTNIRWEVEVSAEAARGSTLRMTTRWLPGPLGWPLVLLLALVRRDALAQRSQRTVERARDVLEAVYPQAGPPRQSPDGRAPKARHGRRR